ncbi:membrane protein [Gordonia phage Aflac]|uniref:Uncharacterized protein n=1 Tax=Gordonia phage Duffington TaxID=2507858 RepID=A0A410TCJ9_9CAUD|nr:hypothetical protein HWC06_gp44 [Gordonia phage Duffington]QKY79437.1 membrane protein [Gordonia phage Jodelie19]QWY82377.1 membrane protein [Gordonia phage Aflac]QXO13052.1 membrane protein [Gordonia phage Figliar]WNT45122.1 membrane protein [Gordonia phage OlgasClover]QAU06750.1 hypothetical protein SEA_DUFFINGTON_44 [Gordonia phage Duffington]
MRKATFVFSVLSFVTSVATLGVITYGVKKLNDDIQDVRAKTNDSLQKMKAALLTVSI